jgi:hypothetical protein
VQRLPIARGRLVGMVDLRPGLVAGKGAGAQAVTMVPVNTIRAFLQRQHLRRRSRPQAPSINRSCA